MFDMQTIKRITLVMENNEQIAVNASDLNDLEFGGTSDQIVKIGNDIVAFRSAEELDMAINAKANHTYNKFGRPSEELMFTKLDDENTIIAAIIFELGDNVIKEYFIPDYVEQATSVDENGNLRIHISPCIEGEDEDDGLLSF